MTAQQALTTLDSSNGNNVSTALTKIIFSYAGCGVQDDTFEAIQALWLIAPRLSGNNAHNVLNEVKGGTKTLRWASPVALTLVFILYMFANGELLGCSPGRYHGLMAFPQWPISLLSHWKTSVTEER